MKILKKIKSIRNITLSVTVWDHAQTKIYNTTRDLSVPKVKVTTKGDDKEDKRNTVRIISLDSGKQDQKRKDERSTRKT